MTQTQAFIDDVLPDAHAAAKALGIPTSVVLAQWINETGSGGSKYWKTGNNPAGISFMEDQMRRLGATVPRTWNPILKFPTREAGLLGYILRWRDPVYAATRARWHAQPSPIDVAIAVQDSPWAGGHYDHHGLVDLINQLGLARYDTPDTGAPPGPVPAQPGGTNPTGTPCAALTPGPPPSGHPLLKIGMHGSAVAVVQELLRQHGFKPAGTFNASGKPDGIFGPHTVNAVVAFQDATGLHPDGIVGRQVYCALGIN